MPDGNETQLKIIGKQLFEVWKAESGERQSRWHASAPAWLAFLISVAGILWMGGVQSQSVDSNTRRIDTLERNAREDANVQRDMLNRLGSMEAKIDILIEERNKK